MSNEVIEQTDKANEIMEKGEQNNLWPQDLNKQEKKQLAYISSQYGLDPFFSDLTVLGGNPYVTASGLKRNAHESDDPPVSIQLEKEASNSKRHFEYKAKLWKQSTPDDKPYVEYGEASPEDCNSQISKTDKDLKAMARTRAVNRVIRLAYNISLTSAEEMSGYDPETQEIKNVSLEENNKSTTRNYNDGINCQDISKSDLTTETAKKVVMDAGKHEGKQLKNINDDNYLKWVSENWDQPVIQKAAKILVNGNELTEREAEIKDMIDGDKEVREAVKTFMKTKEVKDINKLDVEDYEDLKELIEQEKNSDEELAKEAAEIID